MPRPPGEQKDPRFIPAHNFGAINTFTTQNQVKQQTKEKTMKSSPIRSALAAPKADKSIPKKAVSFAKKSKHHRSSKVSFQINCTDEVLQSVENKRRYQRRGSKTPAMLLKSQQEFSLSQATCETPQKRIERRRVSLMTALKHSFQQSCILDLKQPAVARQIRRMSLEHQRSYRSLIIQGQASPGAL